MTDKKIRTQPLYWKNNVKKIRETLKILSTIPGNYLDYASCHLLQDCLIDYANTCENLQKKEKLMKIGEPK